MWVVTERAVSCSWQLTRYRQWLLTDSPHPLNITSYLLHQYRISAIPVAHLPLLARYWLSGGGRTSGCLIPATSGAKMKSHKITSAKSFCSFFSFSFSSQLACLSRLAASWLSLCSLANPASRPPAFSCRAFERLNDLTVFSGARADSQYLRYELS